MTRRLTDDEVAELARLFPPGVATTDFFRQAGLDVVLLPPVAAGFNALQYWGLVNNAIGDGVLERGRRRVLQAALKRFPYNQVLRAALGPGAWRVMFVAASPAGMDSIRSDREYRQIRDADESIEVLYHPVATASDLSGIRRDRPDLLHLACHGDGEMLVFHDRAGGSHALNAADIAATLRVYADELRVRLRGIVLNACYSEAAGRLLRSYADTVLAHRDVLADDDGIAFAGALYRALGDAGTLGSAARIAAAELVRDDAAYRAVAAGLCIFDGEG